MSKSNQDRRHSRQTGYQGDMHEQLGQVLGRKLPPKPMPPLMRAASSWQEEGTDHINIDAFSKTDLGRWLELGKPIAFKHSIFDMFNTVLGFWYYIRSEEQPDILRRLAGKALREFGQKGIKSNRKIKHVKAMVLDAAYQRIRQSAGLYKLFHENELPFDSYRTNASGVRIRNSNHEWIIPGYMEIQRAIHSGVEPNFSAWCDGETNDIYESVRPAIPVEIQERLAAKKNKPAVKQGKPKKSGKPQVLNKVRREDYTVTAEDGYCPAIPVINDRNDEMFLKNFRTTARVNGIPVPTGPVWSGIQISPLYLSENMDWMDQGLIDDDDVVRAFPITDQTFRVDNSPQALLKLTSFVLFAPSDRVETEYTYVPVNLKVTSREYSGQGDQQSVQLCQNDISTAKGYSIARKITVYKAVDSIFTQNGEVPGFVKAIQERFKDHELASELKFVLIQLNFNVSYLDSTISSDTTILLEGTANVVGMSTGTYENRDKVVVALDIEESVFETLNVAGYTYSLARGRPLPPLPKVEEQQLDEEIRQALVNLDNQVNQEVRNDISTVSVEGTVGYLDQHVTSDIGAESEVVQS